MPNCVVIEKLWSKTVVNVETKCWLRGEENKYNRVRYNYKDWLIHRLSLCVYLGFKYTDRSWIACHTCNNKNCWNPCHLYKGTSESNTQDSIVAGIHTSLSESGKIVCPKGHPYDKENTYYYEGKRHCIICKKANRSAWYYRQKEKAKCPTV
jgi:hypothetical protein